MDKTAVGTQEPKCTCQKRVQRIGSVTKKRIVKRDPQCPIHGDEAYYDK